MTPTTPPADETESLFAEYLKAQVPHPWPACRALARSEPAELSGTPGRSDRRSRLTLAASIAILLGGGLALSTGPRPEPAPDQSPAAGPNLLNSATADGKAIGSKGSLPVPDSTRRR